MKRSGFKRQVYAPPPSPPPARGRMASMAPVDDTVVATPKDPRYEDKHLLRMARGWLCLLAAEVCNNDPDTTVACHSNSSQHGKAGARKAHDCYVVYGCSSCHTWLDQGKAPQSEKAAVFAAGHARQVDAWRVIASDPHADARDRASAQGALDKIADDALRAPRQHPSRPR